MLHASRIQRQDAGVWIPAFAGMTVRTLKVLRYFLLDIQYWEYPENLIILEIPIQTNKHKTRGYATGPAAADEAIVTGVCLSIFLISSG